MSEPSSRRHAPAAAGPCVQRHSARGTELQQQRTQVEGSVTAVSLQPRPSAGVFGDGMLPRSKFGRGSTSRGPLAGRFALGAGQASEKQILAQYSAAKTWLGWRAGAVRPHAGDSQTHAEPQASRVGERSRLVVQKLLPSERDQSLLHFGKSRIDLSLANPSLDDEGIEAEPVRDRKLRHEPNGNFLRAVARYLAGRHQPDLKVDIEGSGVDSQLRQRAIYPDDEEQLSPRG